MKGWLDLNDERCIGLRRLLEDLLAGLLNAYMATSRSTSSDDSAGGRSRMRRCGGALDGRNDGAVPSGEDWEGINGGIRSVWLDDGFLREECELIWEIKYKNGEFFVWRSRGG
jgi:hypothetical protein